ncbi:hypothetical protein K456DRAFT_434545 [Colletotrichum gloeosporioides 23]|nr:hypothetical protein K456DRAFT_434545 [Colletotrichum gloeosporioides 23]
MSIRRGKLRRVPGRDQWADMSVFSFGPKVRGPRTRSIMLKKSDSVTPIAIRNGSGKSLKGGLLGCWSSLGVGECHCGQQNGGGPAGDPRAFVAGLCSGASPETRGSTVQTTESSASHSQQQPNAQSLSQELRRQGLPLFIPGPISSANSGGGGQAVRVAVTRPSDTAYNCPQNLPANSPPRVSVSVLLLFELVSETGCSG